MPAPPPYTPLRQAIVLQVRQLMGGTGDDTLERNRCDTGLFGPDSACWKVHGDFASMMVGGVAALLLQMLHPGPLAGVWDHSNFRQDMQGRLKRTARFIAGTTYGDVREAQELIDRVLSVHGRVAGVLPDGSAYSANDPDLLTWVHVAEVSSFLAAYLRYVDPAFSSRAQDLYYRETAEIARRLGAVEVPQSRAEVEAYLQAMRPRLGYDHRTREVARALLSQKAVHPAPEWAARMHGFRMSPPRRATTRLGFQALGRTLRWALVNSAEVRARRRADELAHEGEEG